MIQLTIAGEDGDTITKTSETYKNFIDYLNLHRDTNHLVDVVPHKQRYIVLKAIIQVDPAYIENAIVSTARAAVLKYFDFDNLQLGQGIHLSTVYDVLQKVEGVTAVRIEGLDYKEQVPSSLQPHLRIAPDQIATVEDEDDVKIFSDLTERV